MKAFVLAVVVLAGTVTASPAAEPWLGRWAEDAKNCTKPGESGNETPMTFTRTSARWFGTCKIRSIRTQAKTWILSAKCPRSAALLRIHLHMQGEKLEAFWGEAHPQVMVRCAS